MSNVLFDLVRVPNQFYPAKENPKLELPPKTPGINGSAPKTAPLGATAPVAASSHIPPTLYPEEHGINDM